MELILFGPSSSVGCSAPSEGASDVFVLWPQQPDESLSSTDLDRVLQHLLKHKSDEDLPGKSLAFPFQAKKEFPHVKPVVSCNSFRVFIACNFCLIELFFCC